jgi:hypothetical protein
MNYMGPRAPLHQAGRREWTFCLTILLQSSSSLVGSRSGLGCGARAPARRASDEAFAASELAGEAMDEASTSASGGVTRRAFPPARSGGESRSDDQTRFDSVRTRFRPSRALWSAGGGLRF